MRILQLAAVLFALKVPVWAVEAKTVVIEKGGPVPTGNLLSGGAGQSNQFSAGMTAPGLLAPIGAPVGAPEVAPSKTAAITLPLTIGEPAPAGTMTSEPPALPQSEVVSPVPLRTQALTPAPQGPLDGSGKVQAAPGEDSETGSLRPDDPDQPQGPPGPELIERAKATAASLTGQTPAAAPSPDVQAAQRYIRDIMGSRRPTESETEVLLQDFLDLRGIDPGSARGQAIRQVLLASKLQAEASAVAQLDPKYKAVGSFILAAAKEYGVTPAHVTAVVEKRGFGGLLAGVKSKEQASRILDSVLARDRFERFLARYPKNRQGDLMRDVASNMLVRSGKSIEEVSHPDQHERGPRPGPAVAQRALLRPLRGQQVAHRRVPPEPGPGLPGWR
ncbi:MAG: hypothetical protein NTY77_04810 [Elusimicrobia bacterium]|nr:hypothetical protein [Elusimicrobiota bacterium]